MLSADAGNVSPPPTSNGWRRNVSHAGPNIGIAAFVKFGVPISTVARTTREPSRRTAHADVEPPDPWIAAEPRHLASRELPGPFHGALRGFIERDPTVEVLRQLRVADRPGGGDPPAEAAIEQPLDLVQPAVPQHGEHPLADPDPPRLPVHPDAGGTYPVGVVAIPRRREGAERRATDRGHLERADDPTNVAGLDARGGHGIRVGQPTVQGIRPEVVGWPTRIPWPPRA